MDEISEASPPPTDWAGCVSQFVDNGKEPPIVAARRHGIDSPGQHPCRAKGDKIWR